MTISSRPQAFTTDYNFNLLSIKALNRKERILEEISKMDFQLGFKVHLQLRTTSKAEVIRHSLFKEGIGFAKFLKLLLT